MTTVARTFPCPPDDVVAVLSDGWLYGLWVVGAARIRGVEADWPAQGTRLHHSSGPWPLHLDDHTTVVTSDLPRHLELTARAWPFGRARIHLTLTEVPGGTRVALAEEVVSGVGLLVPRPLSALAFQVRNRECLTRLEQVVMGRSGRRPASAEDDDRPDRPQE